MRELLWCVGRAPVMWCQVHQQCRAPVGRMRAEIQQQMSDDYARQFVAAIRADLKVRRNEDAINAMKKRLAASGG